MPTSKITSKGQATIPKSIRQMLNVRPHDRIAFHVREGRVWIDGQKRDLKGLFGKYRDRTSRKATVEEMNDAIRKRAARC